MINRIHFNAFGGGLYPGGAYNWMRFFCLQGDGPATRQPRSQGPLLPVPVKQNV